MPDTVSISDSLSLAEATVLRAYASQTAPDAAEPHERVEVARTTQGLIARGLLERVDRGILVTPEGLATLLDLVPIMRTASRSEDSAAGLPDAPTRRNTGSRTSGARSARRGPAPN